MIGRSSILRALVAIAIPFASLVAIPACDDETIVLATVPIGDAAPPLDAPVRCVTSTDGGSDCPDGTYCEKDTCGAAAGTCEPFPTNCPNDEMAVCGCDGVTYFNECLRRANGVAAGSDGPCTFANALTCGFTGAPGCPTDVPCARLIGLDTGPHCPNDYPGTCWVLPAKCPPAPSKGGPLWDECTPDGPRCEETCAAIRSGNVARAADQCAPPQ